MLLTRTLALIALAAPAAAWEASSQGPVCFLTHEDEGSLVEVSHDPRRDLAYAIRLDNREAPWAAAPVFAIRFEGPSRLTISTDRHTLSANDEALTVMDSGFGNVLDGIEFNQIGIAILGEQSLAFPLKGAAPAVQAFRACSETPTT